MARRTHWIEADRRHRPRTGFPGWRPGAWVVAVLPLLVTVAGPVRPAWAATECGVRIFAVDSATGHLMEMSVCQDTDGARFEPAVEVDDTDWRGYRRVAAATNGVTTALYAVTTTGELWWRRQEAPRARLGAAVRVAPSIDWSQYASVIAAGRGYLHAVGLSVQTFRHDGWATGGTELRREQDLLAVFAGRSMMAVRWGAYGEAVERGLHYRIFRAPYGAGYTEHDDRWYLSGALPVGLSGVVGAEPRLYGIDDSGAVALLTQPRHPPTPAAAGFPARKIWDCPLCNTMEWQSVAVSTGSYLRVVVPVDGAYGASLPTLALPVGGADCPLGPEPYEWQ